MAELRTITEKEFKGKLSEIKEAIRVEAFDSVVEAMKAKYGEENVTITGKSEVATAVLLIETEEGFTVEACVTFSPTVKDYKERQTAKSFFPEYDREFEGSQWQKKVEKDEKENAEKEEKAKKNKEKVEKKKAEAKAKKEAKA
jgi:hypothetical protein